MSRLRVCWTLLLVGYLGLFLLVLSKVEPFYTFAFLFAWWIYILAVSGSNHSLKGNSFLFGRPREFLILFSISVVFWLFFEAYNLRLNNWYYLGVPVEHSLRWPAYVLSFGTVLPAILETEILFSNLGVFEGLRARGVRVHRPLVIRFVLLGGLMMLAPLVSPDIFFPLIWLGLIFLLDPLLYLFGGKSASLLGRAEQGDYGLAARLLLVGLVCGMAWEFWNWWAGSKWIYSIPYLDFLKVFEMPLLGYLGFPVFALECYLFYQCFCLLRQGFLANRAVAFLAAFFAAFFSVAVLYAIDLNTVVTYRVVW